MDYDSDDKRIIADYKKKNPWGMACSIDLKECDPKTIRDAAAIKDFVSKLCKLIEMKTFGETIVVDFGEDPRVSGFSMTQLIETSLISAHFANETNAIYLDVFSCKEYPPYKAAEFAKRFFMAKNYKISIGFRY